MCGALLHFFFFFLLLFWRSLFELFFFSVVLGSLKPGDSLSKAEHLTGMLVHMLCGRALERFRFVATHNVSASETEHLTWWLRDARYEESEVDYEFEISWLKNRTLIETRSQEEIQLDDKFEILG